MTFYGSCPINAIHKTIQMLCGGGNPIKAFLSQCPQRASRWAQSGNNHKWQISRVSTSEAETRQEQENLHAQPFNWAQRKNISIPSGRKSDPFPCPASSQIILIQCRHQRKASEQFIYTSWNDKLQLHNAILCSKETESRDFKHSLYSTTPYGGHPETSQQPLYVICSIKYANKAKSLRCWGTGQIQLMS